MAEARDHREATSERISASPGRSRREQLIYQFHLASYDFAVPYAAGRSVLDLGCGTGYGTARLAPRCKSIVGVDVSEQAVSAAAAGFRAPNLQFRTVAPTEIAPLPFEDSSFDVVLSFQVIEHVADPVGYLTEARRVLVEGGVMIVATPDRATRLFRGQRPWNRFHLREYAPLELEALARKVFPTVEMYGMGGPEGLLAPELRRTRRLRVATIPFTFPGSPERWRQFGLVASTRMRAAVQRSGAAGSEDTEASSGGAGRAPGAGDDGADPAGVRIGADVHPSVCIVAVAR